MTAYVDYNYYKEDFKGTDIPKSSFDKKAMEASSKVNYYTFGRIKEYTIDNVIRNATCCIAELLYNQEQLILQVDSEQLLASETVGPHTKNYINNSAYKDKRILTTKELNKECYSICLEILGNTGLMYRGF